ncbi:MAG: tetratricopeptide repeat protein, partial [Candidatus Zixiibacteriota bacterium]
DWPEAVRRLEKSRELFEMFENMHGLARVYDNLSHVYYSQNERAKAEEYLNKAVSILAQIGVIGEDPQPEMWQSGAW